MAEQAGTLSRERNLSLKIVVPLSKSTVTTFPASVHIIHCLLSFLQAQTVCGSHGLFMKKFSTLL
jgi:hypothetical protein